MGRRLLPAALPCAVMGSLKDALMMRCFDEQVPSLIRRDSLSESLSPKSTDGTLRRLVVFFCLLFVFLTLLPKFFNRLYFLEKF